jgi:hypothetical protein
MTDEQERPLIWTGHLILHVKEPKTCAAFYEQLGMRPVEVDAKTSVMALRGGTHLVLIGKPDAVASAARFDLMVDDHEAMRSAWETAGIQVSPITIDPRNGHRIFTVTDPEGNTMVVNNSHVVGVV